MAKMSIADKVSMAKYDACVDDILEVLANTCDDVRVGYQIIIGMLAMLAQMNEREPEQVLKDVQSMYMQVESMREVEDLPNVVNGNGTVN